VSLDILFLAKNRLEFTKESLTALLANTNWSLVRALWLWDDGSTDGTDGYLAGVASAIVPVLAIVTPHSNLGSPAAIMNEAFRHPEAADVICKIDADTIVPPGWLGACHAVMEAHPELDLLGIEPPASRTPHFEGGPRKPAPEDDYRTWHGCGCEAPAGIFYQSGYASCDSIGGIGLMRTKTFLENEPLRPHSIYGGFTEWQLQHPRIRKGWIVPPLDVFLLDRMPGEPWASLSREYEAKGWQRAWSKYPKDSTLWEWWTPCAS
jgi:glycosyltransferase involved in cell wall biosynthesis